MCRSDAPRSIMMVKRSCIVAAMATLSPPLVSCTERHAQHFFDRHAAVDHLLQRVLPERPHALTLRGLADLDGGSVPDNEITNVLIDGHDLVDGHAPLHSREVAGGAALPLVEADLPQPLRDMPVGHAGLLGAVIGPLARLADLAAEPPGPSESETRVHA